MPGRQARFLVVILCLMSGMPVLAQESWQWPERPQNLQVLPKDWPGSRLEPPMRGFARVLGVTCAYCHVGKEGEPWSTYDFASDANPNKDRAREMIRMLGSINDHLKKIEVSGDQRINMWCHTCHRGRPKPMTLAEELGEVYRKEGLEPALAHYRELKRDYYGRGAYEFSESALNGLGYQLLRSERTADAVAVFQLNADEFPDSPNVWDSLAEGHMKAGNKAEAIRFYEKSLSLNPANQNARDMLAQLREGN